MEHTRLQKLTKASHRSESIIGKDGDLASYSFVSGPTLFRLCNLEASSNEGR